MSWHLSLEHRCNLYLWTICTKFWIAVQNGIICIVTSTTIDAGLSFQYHPTYLSCIRLNVQGQISVLNNHQPTLLHQCMPCVPVL